MVTTILTWSPPSSHCHLHPHMVTSILTWSPPSSHCHLHPHMATTILTLSPPPSLSLFPLPMQSLTVPELKDMADATLKNMSGDQEGRRSRLIMEGLLDHYFAEERSTFADRDLEWFMEMANKQQHWLKVALCTVLWACDLHVMCVYTSTLSMHKSPIFVCMHEHTAFIFIYTHTHTMHTHAHTYTHTHHRPRSHQTDSSVCPFSSFTFKD